MGINTSSPTHEQELSPVYWGRHLHFYVHPSGWEFVRRPTARQGVTIVAATDRNKIVLVEQYRVPMGRAVIELPAGLVGDTCLNERDDLISAAKRELEEETGYACRDVEVICGGPLLPGLTDEINALCWAKGLTLRGAKDGQDDNQVYQHQTERGIASEGERIQVYDVPLATVEEWLQEQIGTGKVVDLKVYLGVFFLKNVLAP
jgi:ADP-ribose pyrophosphatase